MKLVSLTVAGFRAFNDEQTIDLDGCLVIYCGPSGAGKTSIGECIEWLLYGTTLKRSKGDQISKREYALSYRNAHFNGPGKPFVELNVQDAGDRHRVIRRELNDDETSGVTVDGKPVKELSEFGIGTLYDRPLILQHTLQDFIYMKPKTRYQVLSAMLGLEELTEFRNAVQQAKAELPGDLPSDVRRALARSFEIKNRFHDESLLKPVAAAIEQGDLKTAREQLVAVALGRVPSGTEEADLPSSLKAIKATKERAQLDWGRFSFSPISDPGKHPAISELSTLGSVLEEFHGKLKDAHQKLVDAEEKKGNSKLQQFIALGLEIRTAFPEEICPFCEEQTLTTAKIEHLKELARTVPAAKSILQDAHQKVTQLMQQLNNSHYPATLKLFPVLPSNEERRKIEELVDNTPQCEAFLTACSNLSDAKISLEERKETLERTLQSVLNQLDGGKSPKEIDVKQALGDFSEHVNSIPALSNAYAAGYSVLDPYIKSQLGSLAEVKFLQLLIDGLETWEDIETASLVDYFSELLQELIRQTRHFTRDKQAQILGIRDKEIKEWYDILNPASKVGYEKMVPGTDSLELQARSFSKIIMAAPNLSACQLNCLGLAIYLACATRTGSPHRMLLFDDPIQSMDDEHTEAFKLEVLRKLLDEGFQVVLLTHIDNFAEGVEKLYRSSAEAALYRMQRYEESGPVIEFKGPELRRLLEEVRKNKTLIMKVLGNKLLWRFGNLRSDL